MRREEIQEDLEQAMKEIEKAEEEFKKGLIIRSREEIEKTTWEEIKEEYYSITSDFEHGECFYDLDMLQQFCASLDRLKNLSYIYHEKIISEKHL